MKLITIANFSLRLVDLVNWFFPNHSQYIIKKLDQNKGCQWQDRPVFHWKNKHPLLIAILQKNIFYVSHGNSQSTVWNAVHLNGVNTTWLNIEH